MNVKRLAVLLVGCLAMLLLAAKPASAVCKISNAREVPIPDLNAEGLTERAADIKITDDGTLPGCFQPGSIIFVEYGAVMSVPGSFGLADRGKYWDFGDSTDSLSLDNITIDQPLSPSGFVTKVEFHVNFGTTSEDAFILLENLRFDVTGTTGTNFQSVGDGNPLNARVGTNNPPTLSAFFDVGNVKKTVEAAGVSTVGWGFEDGVCPFVPGCGYPNVGGTDHGSLLQQARWFMTTNHLWATDFAFRRVNEKSGNPTDPNLIGQTDLVIDVENIMSGVTVQLPAFLIKCDSATPPNVIAEWKLVSSTPSNPTMGGDLVGIYQTIEPHRGTSTTLTVDTTNGPPYNGCPGNPLISVKIGNPSGRSADLSQQAYLRVVMGPAPEHQFTGDDEQPNAVPRYLNDITAGDSPTRSIIGSADPDQTVPYFFLNPTQTVILYPFVTNLAGWQTGIEVGNTGNDGAVFGNKGQSGALDCYFFGTLNGVAQQTFSQLGCGTGGRGLESGVLTAGNDFAETLNGLLADVGKGGASFEGYLIIVAHFNFGHGAAMVFNTAGSVTAVPGLILGGNCSFNANRAPFNPVTGAPGFPACSSAREGDLRRLPERLDQ